MCQGEWMRFYSTETIRIEWRWFIDLGVEPKYGKTPQIIHFNRVFHYFHHPFWVPLFLETSIWSCGNLSMICQTAPHFQMACSKFVLERISDWLAGLCLVMSKWTKKWQFSQTEMTSKGSQQGGGGKHQPVSGRFVLVGNSGNSFPWNWHPLPSHRKMGYVTPYSPGRYQKTPPHFYFGEEKHKVASWRFFFGSWNETGWNFKITMFRCFKGYVLNKSYLTFCFPPSIPP